MRRDGARDEVAVEEPLEIRVDGCALTVTMRTPGHDDELALGFLYGEGLIDAPRAAGLTDDLAANIVEVHGPLLRDPGARRFYTTSSCGVCGKGALEEVAVHARAAARRPAGGARTARGAARAPAPAGFRAHRRHARDRPVRQRRRRCCSCARTSGATTRWTRSIGRALRDGRLPLHGHVLCVSGRLSFELVQKAAVAGAPILVGAGAPTSLAIELAADRGMTLAGFARGESVNVYCGAERVAT